MDHAVRQIARTVWGSSSTMFIEYDTFLEILLYLRENHYQGNSPSMDIIQEQFRFRLKGKTRANYMLLSETKKRTLAIALHECL